MVIFSLFPFVVSYIFSFSFSFSLSLSFSFLTLNRIKGKKSLSFSFQNEHEPKYKKHEGWVQRRLSPTWLNRVGPARLCRKAPRIEQRVCAMVFCSTKVCGCKQMQRMRRGRCRVIAFCVEDGVVVEALLQRIQRLGRQHQIHAGQGRLALCTSSLEKSDT